jgi:hypothetical protein
VAFFVPDWGETLRTVPHDGSTAIPTAGIVFEDGGVIELVENSTQPDGLGLLMRKGRRSVAARRVVHAKQAYVPPQLTPSLRRALRLPQNSSPIISTADLFAKLLALALRFTDLAEDSCCLLIGFVFATWVSDCLPAPINLGLWSPVAADAARVLRFLSCFCRQSLTLSGTSAQDLDLLPPELQATLLIFRPSSGRRTSEVLSTCGWRGFYAARGGEFRQFLGSVALATDSPLGDRMLEPMIEVAVPPSRRVLPVLDERSQRELASEFLPKLLEYRFRHFDAAVRVGSVDADFSTGSTPLIAGLGACFSDEPELRDRQVALLRDQSEHEARSADPRLPVIEALWARCHERDRERLHVAELAADVNAILSLSGGLRLSDRMVGSLLNALGFRTSKLDRHGRGIKLDSPTRRLIHQLAKLHGAPSAETLFHGCAECAQQQIVEA